MLLRASPNDIPREAPAREKGEDLGKRLQIFSPRLRCEIGRRKSTLWSTYVVHLLRGENLRMRKAEYRLNLGRQCKYMCAGSRVLPPSGKPKINKVDAVAF